MIASVKFLIVVLITLGLSSCSNKAEGIAVLEPVPANAMILASINNLESFNISSIETDRLPKIKSLKFLIENFCSDVNGAFLVSYHPVGVNGHHWLISIPRNSAKSWHPSGLSGLNGLERRSYSIGTIWKTQLVTIGETSNYILISTSSILTEEGIRQIEKGGGQYSYEYFKELPNKLLNNDFITLNRNEKINNLSILWPLFNEKEVDDIYKFLRLQQPKSLSWNFNRVADSNSFSAVSDQFDIAETSIDFMHLSETIPFPGWKWMVPELNWGAWISAKNKLTFKDQSFISVASGELCFKGRGNRTWKASVYYSDNINLTIQHWENSNGLEIKNLNSIDNPLKKPPTYSFIKRFGPFLISVADSNMFNRYGSYLGIIRSEKEEKEFQGAMKWIKSQPAEANIWWVTNAKYDFINSETDETRWNGLSLRLLNNKASWWASKTLKKK